MPAEPAAQDQEQPHDDAEYTNLQFEYLAAAAVQSRDRLGGGQHDQMWQHDHEGCAEDAADDLTPARRLMTMARYWIGMWKSRYLHRYEPSVIGPQSAGKAGQRGAGAEG